MFVGLFELSFIIQVSRIPILGIFPFKIQVLMKQQIDKYIIREYLEDLLYSKLQFVNMLEN